MGILHHATPATATHFRASQITWQPISANTIQFKITNAFRRNGYSNSFPFPAGCINPQTLAAKPCSGSDGFASVGDVIYEYIGTTRFFPGDGSIIGSPLFGTPANPGALLYEVTSIDPGNNWLFGEAIDPGTLPAVSTNIRHTYTTQGKFTANIDSCCRISPLLPPNAHINNPDGPYRVETTVLVGSANSSPVSSLPPIVFCPQNSVCSFIVPAADPNQDRLRFRLSLPSEAASSGAFIQPGPPHAPNAASISSTGVYTWNTTGATLGPAGFNTVYSTQVTIEDLDASGAVKSKIAVDFFIQLVPKIGVPPVFNNAPSVNCGSTVSVKVGERASLTVRASDPDAGQSVTLNVAGLPVGATMTPALPATGNPVSSTLTWTPTANEAGTHVITFTATDNSAQLAGQQTLCSITVVAIPTGRMTGGGSVLTASGIRVTHGFTLYCNPADGPNNLEVNWDGGNRFHLERLTLASCSDDEAITQQPPTALFDTHNGFGTGRYNGVSGATIEWVFVDAGEPGSKDTARLVIKDAAGNTVLSVATNLVQGNHQAHK